MDGMGAQFIDCIVLLFHTKHCTYAADVVIVMIAVATAVAPAPIQHPFKRLQTFLQYYKMSTLPLDLFRTLLMLIFNSRSHANFMVHYNDL